MKRLIAKLTLGLLALFTALFAFDIISSAAFLLGIVFTQLAAFTASAPQGSLFLVAGLTPGQVNEFENIISELRDTYPALEKRVDVLRADLDQHRKQALSRFGGSSGIRIPGKVTIECARHLSGLALAAGIRQGVVSGNSESLIKDILGAEYKTALTSSDIPLPTEYSGEVSELVGQYGSARQYGTVFPLGANPTKLPYLSTDTTFTVLAIATAITEKSPQVGLVTFTPEKFGGLIRMPTEIDEDSIVPMGQFLARYAARNMARAEDWNFWCSTGVVGTVNGDVEGLTVSTITNSKVTQMAGTKTHFSDVTIDNLRTLRTVVDSAALRSGAYYMHPTFEGHLAGLNTAGNRPYNPQAQIAGTGAQPFVIGPTLDGFPIRWIDVLPAYATGVNASKVCVLFGDASFQYLGLRGGLRFDSSSHAGFATDEILIRCVERFTIGLMALGAMAGLETAAA